MKIKYWSMGVVSALLISGCQMQSPVLEGTLDAIQADSLYLYQVTNDWYGTLEKEAAIPVKDGTFTYSLDSLKFGLYALALENQEMSRVTHFAKLFIEPVPMKVTVRQGDYEELDLQVEGSSLNERYTSFVHGLNVAGNKVMLDSLDRAFYAARDKGDTALMAKIKTESMPYYDKSREQSRLFIDQAILKEQHTAFGLYLYYTDRFQNQTFNTVGAIDTVFQHLQEYPDEARQMVFYSRITDTLERFRKCAIGSKAPFIEGVDADGKQVSLDNFKGRYVLVDFWSSGCHWCRLETPHLQKVYDAFKDKNFTILGVSSDYRKEDWLRAIDEDKSFWNQIIVPRKEIRPLMDRYCIVGIPHIILVDPSGVIIAKDLRGEDIYQTVESYIQKK